MSRNTIARIDLAALRHNFGVVRTLAPRSAIVAVVKADAYGHGIGRVSEVLQDAGLLAVATTGEGFVCRQHGWRGRLLLLEGPANPDEFDAAQALGAEMVVHHESQLELLRQRRRTVTRSIWLKIDTGMHRLGFPAGEAPAVHAEISRLLPESPTVLMTHFACADDTDNPMTRRQISQFDAATKGLGGPASLANSAGILNYPDSHHDYVRPGILLYGISPCRRKSAADIGLRPAMELSCELIAVNRVPAGESVGYGAEFSCVRDTVVGVGAIGYGDGYPRHARNGTPVLINGRRAALVGRVSMDMVTIDLSGHADTRVGDRVVLWGQGLPVEEVAAWADAIPYQLICGVTARVRFETV